MNRYARRKLLSACKHVCVFRDIMSQIHNANYINDIKNHKHINKSRQQKNQFSAQLLLKRDFHQQRAPNPIRRIPPHSIGMKRRGQVGFEENVSGASGGIPARKKHKILAAHFSMRARKTKEAAAYATASFILAGGLGFEPRLTESESVVLPLDDPPSAGAGVFFKQACGRINRSAPAGRRVF